jgi:hypothetical protein
LEIVDANKRTEEEIMKEEKLSDGYKNSIKKPEDEDVKTATKESYEKMKGILKPAPKRESKKKKTGVENGKM